MHNPTMDHVSSNTTENIPNLHFVWGKEIHVILEIFSCVNRFEFHGNKPLEFLMNTFGNTRYLKIEI